MRVYTFTHFMLSTMAQGIQAGHAKDELVNKYIYGKSEQRAPEMSMNIGNMLQDWSVNYKTHIALNGGETPDLHELIDFLDDGNCPYPWAFFEEDDSLGGLVTSIALVLPDKIYETASLLRTREITRIPTGFHIDIENKNFYDYKAFLDAHTYSNFDFELIDKLNTYRMAS